MNTQLNTRSIMAENEEYTPAFNKFSNHFDL